ncbi:hypothetical protein LLE49_24130 [Alicyclobacillus tolerans]|uniref:hypothetical protein n=1 Tax=Alicyclobacillus tolerans TaxID=90970 RepID=UPI001F190761|nr:hypothetical protein [Alicyclobacillus tolerans]MCF8567813.1 hypothetical protein [Alicyclobacillus tolerans]
MPAVNGIRYVNIYLDKGTKVIPNNTYKYYGLDALSLLENGGGKTSIIQLMAQLVLPGTKMGERALDELVGRDKTGHVAISWILDGDVRRYLCTGICLSNQPNKIDTFTYLYEYQEGDALTFDNLPLVDANRTVVTYSGLKASLEAAGVRVYGDDKDSVRSYQDALAEYHILKAEWSNILTINTQEGGVDKYFESLKTSKALVSKLLIPTVEQAVFKTRKERDQLREALREHRDILLSIPETLKKLEQFSLITKDAEHLLETVSAYEEGRNAAKAAVKSFVALALALEAETVRLTATKAQDEKTLETTLQGLETVAWKLESHAHHELTQDWRVLKEHLDASSRDLQEAEASLFGAEAEHRTLSATKIRYEARVLEGKAQAIRAEIARMDAAEPDLRAAFLETRQAFLAAWNERQNSLLQEEQAQQKRQDALRIRKKDVEETSTRLQGMREALSQAKGEAITWLETMTQKSKGIEVRINEDAAVSPEQAHRAICNEIEARDTEREILRNKVSFCEERLRDAYSSRQDLALDRQALKSEQASISELVKNYKDEHRVLVEQLSELGIFYHDVFASVPEIDARIRQGLTDVRASRDAITAKLREDEVRLARWADKDYFMPHGDILELVERLEHKGIAVTLGAKWLTEQPLDDEKKRALVRSYPMLPHALLVEPKDDRRVKTEIERLQKDAKDFPILVLNKDSSLMEEAYAGNVWFFVPNEMDAYFSRAWLQKTKAALRSRIEQSCAEQRAIEGTEQLWITLSSIWKEWGNKYPENPLPAFDKRIQDCTRAIEAIEAKQEVNLVTVEATRKEIDDIKTIIENLGEEQKQAEQKRALLEDYLPWFRQNEARQNVLRDTEQRLWETNQELDRLGHDLREIEATAHGLQEKTHELDLKRRELSRDFEEAELDTSLSPAGARGDYAYLKTSVASIQRQLQGKQADRTIQQTLYEELMQEVKNRTEQFFEIEVDHPAIEANLQDISRAALQEAKTRTDGKRAVVLEMEQKQRQLEIEVTRAESKIEALADMIGRRFSGKVPYVYGNQPDLEYKQMRLLQNQAEEQKRTLESRIRKTEETLTSIAHGLSRMEEHGEIYALRMTTAPDDTWRDGAEAPNQQMTARERTMVRAMREETSQKEAVNKAFAGYTNDLVNSGSAELQTFVRGLRERLETGQLYEVAVIQGVFNRIFETLRAMQKDYQDRLANAEKSKKMLVDLCLARARTVYEGVMEIQYSSRIYIYGQTIQCVKVIWDKWEDARAFEVMARYVDTVLEQAMLRGEKQDEFLQNNFTTVSILDALTRIDRCQVRVFKPRKETIVQYGAEMDDWEEAVKYSGGEQYTVFMTMYLLVMTYMRKKVTNRHDTWKVVVADNPFGKASSDHIIDPILEIAKNNRVQLICLTAHREEHILKKFAVVYSNKYYPVEGRPFEMMVPEPLSFGYYTETKLQEKVESTV